MQMKMSSVFNIRSTAGLLSWRQHTLYPIILPCPIFQSRKIVTAVFTTQIKIKISPIKGKLLQHWVYMYCIGNGYLRTFTVLPSNRNCFFGKIEHSLHSFGILLTKTLSYIYTLDIFIYIHIIQSIIYCNILQSIL
jgi:hypothetical protein